MRRARAQATDKAASQIILDEKAARETKTAWLREMRLAKEATAGLPVVDKRFEEPKSAAPRKAGLR
jgi:hypothetical protein